MYLLCNYGVWHMAYGIWLSTLIFLTPRISYPMGFKTMFCYYYD
jgi:hypothetical protein